MNFYIVANGERHNLSDNIMNSLSIAQTRSKKIDGCFEMFDGKGRMVAQVSPRTIKVTPWARTKYLKGR